MFTDPTASGLPRRRPVLRRRSDRNPIQAQLPAPPVAARADDLPGGWRYGLIPLDNRPAAG